MLLCVPEFDVEQDTDGGHTLSDLMGLTDRPDADGLEIELMLCGK